MKILIGMIGGMIIDRSIGQAIFGMTIEGEMINFSPVNLEI